MEILVLTILAGTAASFQLAAFARKRVSRANATHFDTALKEMLDAYQHSLREKIRSNMDVAAIKFSFEMKAARIFTHYSEQFYGGVENVPFEKYAFFKKMTSQFLRKLEIETPAASGSQPEKPVRKRAMRN